MRDLKDAVQRKCISLILSLHNVLGGVSHLNRVEPGTSLNSVTETGFYYSLSVTDAPDYGTAYLFVFNNENPDYPTVLQIWIWEAWPVRTAMRMRVANTWYAWQVVHS